MLMRLFEDQIHKLNILQNAFSEKAALLKKKCLLKIYVSLETEIQKILLSLIIHAIPSYIIFLMEFQSSPSMMTNKMWS